MIIPKPNLKAAKARAAAAQANAGGPGAASQAGGAPAQTGRSAASTDLDRQEDLARLTKIAADAPEVLAALTADKPSACPNGYARKLTGRGDWARAPQWTEQGRRLVALVAELSGVAP